jgi:gas vesicle structural protein
MAIKKSVESSSLAEVVDRILDKGVVIDVYAIVSLVGIQLLTVEARIVIASVKTWLKYARAVGLLEKERHRHKKQREAIA